MSASRPVRAPFVLILRQAGRPANVVPVDRDPFLIGRSAESHCRLEAPGVWDRHLSLTLDPTEGLVATAGEGALASVRSEPFTRHRVRPGEEITLGPVSVQVQLAPALRGRIGGWEWLTWMLLAGVLGLQATLVWRLILE